MSQAGLQHALWGALAALSWVAGLFFVHFWRMSRDRLFLFFGIAFWVFALTWLWQAMGRYVPDHHHYVFLPRLLGFALIIVGVVDKNRQTKARR